MGLSASIIFQRGYTCSIGEKGRGIRVGRSSIRLCEPSSIPATASEILATTCYNGVLAIPYHAMAIVLGGGHNGKERKGKSLVALSLPFAVAPPRILAQSSKWETFFFRGVEFYLK
jgi:hypothetical protein